MSRLLSVSTFAIGLSLIHSLAFCEEPNATDRAGTPAETDEQPAKADFDLAMQRPVSVDFKDVTLSDAADYLSRVSGLQMDLDIEAMREEGIAIEETINLRLDKVSLGSVLKHLLRPLDLVWIREDDTLLITTWDVASENLIVRAYNVAHLIRTTTDSEWDEAHDDYDTLIEVITSSVSPQAWSDGNSSIMGCLRGTLIFSQSREIHEEIAGLIKGLRSTQAMQAARESGLVGRAQVGTPVPISEPTLPDPAEAHILAAMNQKVDLSFEDASLEDVLKQIGETHSLTALIDRRAVEDARIDTNKPVSFTGKGITLEVALRRILAELDLTWIIQDEVLLVTTPEVEQYSISARVYPVADLVKPLHEGDQEDYDSLMEAIQTVTPPNWDDIGGAGNMTSFPPSRALVISQTHRMHAHVERVLTELRKAIGEQPQVEAATKDRSGHDEAMRIVAYRIKVPAWINQEPGEQLVGEVVQTLVSPDSWAKPGAYLKALPGSIVVRQTGSVHKKVDKLLNELGVIQGWQGSGIGGFQTDPAPTKQKQPGAEAVP